MRTLLPWVAAAVAGLALLAASHAADAPTIRGRVLDADGKPVADVDVAPYWDLRDGEAKPLRGIKTDATGTFAAGSRERPVGFCLGFLSRRRREDTGRSRDPARPGHTCVSTQPRSRPDCSRMASCSAAVAGVPASSDRSTK